MITLLISYTNRHDYQDADTPQVYGATYTVDSYEFDEVNENVVHTLGSYDDFQYHNPPVGFSYTGEFFSKCVGTTRNSYAHNGAGGFTITPESDSLSCGFVPPAPLTCDVTVTYQLTATAVGADVVASSQANHGAVQYRLDGSPAQISPRFYDLSPGRHVLTVLDTGLSNCQRSVAFTVATPAPPAAPAGPSAGVDFVEQPLWYAVAAPAGAEVVLELYAESQHRAEDFHLVFRIRKRADASGRINFRLDTLLAPLLKAVVPPASTLATVVCRTPLLSYFVRTATVLATGQSAAFVTSALRTALRGSLPAERRDIDYFAYRLEAYGQPPFLSWQPAGKRITSEQPEWLFWLCPDGGVPVLTVRRSYARVGGLPPVVEDEAVNLSAGRGAFAQLLAIPVRPRAGVASMSVALYDAFGNAVSPLVTFAMVPASPRTRYLHFTNSLGGFDTLRTEGRFEAVLEGVAERYELPATPLGAAPAAERQAFDVAASRKLKLATGWLTAAQLRWLQELVLAREIWEWQSGRLLSIDPAKRQLAYQSDDNPLRGMLLEYDYAFAPTAYANLP